MAVAGTNERVTQGFVGTLSLCWRRPSLTALEVLWRWTYGIPVLFLLRYEAEKILLAAPLDYAALRELTVLDPGQSLLILDAAWSALRPLVRPVALWLVPLLFFGWAVLSSLGRTVVLRRVDPRLRANLGALFWLQVLRATGSISYFFLWIIGLGESAAYFLRPAVSGQDPGTILFLAVAIALTLAIFVLSVMTSREYTLAPLLALWHGWGAWRSFTAAYGLRALRRQLLEINLIMGIVKIALIVLAMVFSASPLPFETVASRAFLTWWWAGVAVLYLLASDFFHVARLVAYLELWRAEAGTPSSPPPLPKADRKAHLTN